MRSRKHQLWVALALVIVIVGGIVTAVLLRRRAAPDAVRLLPECDAVVYVNLEPVRLFTGVGKTPPKDRDPQYEDFVRQSGFEFERDLDKAAFAIHYGVAAKGKQAETRYSEILQGHFDSTRVGNYLRSIASHVDRYEDHDIYSIPVEDRTVRVTLLGLDIAAASNAESAEVIHGMIDRYRRAALPFAGPTLVSQYYRRVPLGSFVWTIARPPKAGGSADHGELLVPGEWSGLLPRDSVVVASARPLNEVRLRADVITGSEAEAQKFTQQMGAYMALFRSLDISIDSGGPDKDVKAAFESLQVRQDKSEAVLTAQVPYGFFKKMLSESPVEFGPEKPERNNTPGTSHVPQAPASQR